MVVLKDIKAENEALKARLAQMEAALAQGVKATQCLPGTDKHGNAVLNFTGNFPPFSLTRQKCAKLLPYLSQIEAFAKTK